MSPAAPPSFARGRAALFCVALLGLVTVAGCRSSRSGAGKEEGTKTAPAEQAALLLPLFHEQGLDGALPERVVIEFARPIVDTDQVHEAVPGATVVKLSPAVGGKLTYLGPSTLAFTPEAGFAPDTRYTVSLEAVRTRAGVLMPSSPWTYSFATGKFAFLHMYLGHVKLADDKDDKALADDKDVAGDPQHKKHKKQKAKELPTAELTLAFSGDVDLESLRSRASFQVDGSAAAKVSFEPAQPHQSASQVRVTLTSERLRPGALIGLTLRQGVTLRHDKARAPAAETEARVDQAALGDSVNIMAAHRSEGGSGHYLDIVCDDDAAGEKRYYWDREQSRGGHESDEEGEDDEGGSGGGNFHISRQCLLRESDATERVHIQPPVKFTVAPSGGGFRILGDFKRGAYTLRIDAGARTVYGGYLRVPFERTFSVPARSPKLSFVSQGRYLPRHSWSNLPINQLNVDEMLLTVRQVPPENLVFWMSEDESEAATERNSNVILKKKIPLKGQIDAQSTAWVDVGTLLPRTTRGMLELTLAAEGAKRTQATARLVLTNINLVAKRGGAQASKGNKGKKGNNQDNENHADPGKNELLVFALDMDSGEPISGVEVRLIKKSGQVISHCATIGQAGCQLRVPEDDLDPSPPFALLASKDDDLTYLKFSELRTDVSEAEVQGEPYTGERLYRAAIYADRGVYRPGETVHLSAILRDAASLSPKLGMPVEAKVIDPRTNVLQKAHLGINAAGMVVLDVPLSSFAATGKYQVDLSVAGKSAGRLAFQVEEFVPERMKASASASATDYLLGDKVNVHIEAHYLFGSVAANHQVELSCQLEPQVFAPKENRQLHFGMWDAGKPKKAMSLGTENGSLDDQGQGRLTCPGTGEAGKYQGTARLTATAAVLEAGSGRTTQAKAEAWIHPEHYYLGLSTGVEQASSGKPLPVSGAVVDWEGKIIPTVSSLSAELYQMEEEYGWSYDEEAGEGSYQHYTRLILSGKTQVPVAGGKFSFSLTPSEDAYRYLVRVKAGKARTDLEVGGTGYHYYWPGESRTDQTPRPLRPTALNLEVKGPVRVGHSETLHFRAPYRGHVLFTIETDHVLSSEWRAVDAGEVNWNFKVEAFAPNVYASVFLVKDPHLDSQQAFMPDRAFGVQSIPMELGEYTQELKLDVPREVRSHGKLLVKLDLGQLEGPTYVTVAAVDEGILSLTHFPTPDPLQRIFERRALGVETFETVGWSLLLPPSGSSRSTGGDGDEEAGDGEGKSGRVQPVKPVALFSGLVSVPQDGKLTISFDLPQYRGSLRVMAVAAGPKRIGRASAQVTVTDPLVVQTTLPRFLTDGDEIEIPVFLSNLSGAAQQATISLMAENLAVPGLSAPPPGEGSPLVLTGPQKATLHLKNGESGKVVFRARAAKQIGAARLRVVARAGNLESSEEADVPFLPAGPRSRIVQRIPLSAGEVDLLPYLSGWVPTSERSSFWVTANPYADAFDHLGYLLHYPYGCIEQTTSAVRPLLFAGALIGSVDPTLLAGKKIEDLVMYGVNRVFSMQVPSGGFAFWPGDTKPFLWGTAYATHMLLDAQKQGYPVVKDRLDNALKFIEEQLTSTFEAGRKPDKDGYYYSGDPEPYLQLVLALAGHGRKGRIQHLIDTLPKNPKGEDREHPYMLKAALYLAGDHRYERDLKHPDVSALSDERSNDWSLYSDRRRRGFMLSTFQDLFGDDPAGEPLAEMVAEGLRGHESGWYTTQELVWAVTGLGKRVSKRTQSFAAPVLLAEGKKIAGTQRHEGKAGDVSFALIRASEYQTLTLTVPRKDKGTLFLILGSEGVRQKPDDRVGGDGLKIARRYLSADGTEIDLHQPLELGQLIYSEVAVTNVSRELVSNIALTDRFPAGWEIENPRLGRERAADWIDKESLWEVDYMNVRDDRIEVFGALDSGESVKLVYVLRAVTAGTFTSPSVEAEAMYDPRIWARQPGGRLSVNPPPSTSKLPKPDRQPKKAK